MLTSPLYPGFKIHTVNRFQDGTLGVILVSKTHPDNILTHTGRPGYLRRTLMKRYGVTV